jgi:hypothetical protein
MANLEVGTKQIYAVATTTLNGLTTFTITIANGAGAVPNTFNLGSSQILGIRYSSTADGKTPVSVGGTEFPTPWYVKSITQTPAAGNISSTNVVIQTQTACAGATSVAVLVWENNVAQSALSC